MRQIAPDVVRAATDRARQIAERLVGRGLPIDIIGLSRQLGVTTIEPREMVEDGYVGRRADGALVIRYRSANCIARNRFTIAHELGHLLLAEELSVDVMDRKHRKGHDAEERAANQIAAELLMPERALRAQLARRVVGWNSIGAFRAMFCVSTTALMQRLLEIPHVASIFGRIGDGRTAGRRRARYRCQTSQKPKLFFIRPVQETMTNLLGQMSEGSFATLEMATETGNVTLRCVGREVRGFGRPEFWITGWRVLEQFEDSQRRWEY